MINTSKFLIALIISLVAFTKHSQCTAQALVRDEPANSMSLEHAQLRLSKEPDFGPLLDDHAL